MKKQSRKSQENVSIQEVGKRDKKQLKLRTTKARRGVEKAMANDIT